jgi:hypothetical protein
LADRRDCRFDLASTLMTESSVLLSVYVFDSDVIGVESRQMRLKGGSMVTAEAEADRSGEWFVPSIGPPPLRMVVGLLFLPYTGMVLSYTLLGSMLAERIYWDRVIGILVVYFLALGIGAHALDALGSKDGKPWGTVLPTRPLWVMALSSILLAYAIGIYYMAFYTPLLWLIAIPEGFFLLAYNLEWFEGQFHTDGWFALSWGMLPVLAGYILQTNRISAPALLVASSMGLLSLVEITASRPYKGLKRNVSALTDEGHEMMQRLERILKSLSGGVMLLGVGLLLWRWLWSA